MDEKDIKEILEEKQEQVEQHHQKKSFWNNKKTVKGKALSAWLIVMVAIFMLFTFGLGIYLGKEIFTEKEKKSNKENNNNIVEDNNNNTVENNNNENINDNGNETQDVPKEIEEANQLLEDITAFDYIDNVEYYGGNEITYYANNKTVDASSLNHELVYQVVFNKYYDDKNLKEISLDDFNSKVKEIFDDSYSYVAKDYYDRCSGNWYKLEGDKYVYVPSYGGCGGTYGFYRAPYKVTTVNKNTNRLEIKVKVLFGESNGSDGTASYYSDYDKTKLVEGANQENYKSYLDNGSTYLFTFINRNGKYLFSRAELI